MIPVELLKMGIKVTPDYCINILIQARPEKKEEIVH
jgi:hypothetical protein